MFGALFVALTTAKNLQKMKKTYVILLSVLAWMLTACQQNEEVNNLLGN